MEKVLLVLFVVNVVLSAASGALHALVAKFPGLADADSFLGKVIGVLQKIVDIASANVAHPAIESKDVPKA